MHHTVGCICGSDCDFNSACCEKYPDISTLHICRVSTVECRISRQCSAMCTAVLQTHRIVRIECRGKQWPHHCIIEVL